MGSPARLIAGNWQIHPPILALLAQKQTIGAIPIAGKIIIGGWVGMKIIVIATIENIANAMLRAGNF